MAKLKYNNKKITIAGKMYDSRLEAKRYMYLSDLQAKGIISNLDRQVTFNLIPVQKGTKTIYLKTKEKQVEYVIERPVDYIADFTYTINATGEWVVEDTKSTVTASEPSFVIKRKLMLYVHGIRLRMVSKATQDIEI